MLTKRIFVLLYTAVLALASVFLFVKIQQRSLIIQLDNHNLSANAYHVVLRERESMWDVTQKIEKSKKIKNVQVHFQDKKNKDLTYFFGTGNFEVPPMITGSFFGSGAFDSEVEVVIVGKSYEKKLYKPKDQEYLKMDSKYVPVLGIMGDKYTSDLDKQIFIAPSIEKSKQLNANSFRIVIDGKKKLDKNTLKNLLGAKRIAHLPQRHFLINQDSWILDHYRELLMLLVLFIMVIFGIVIWTVNNRSRYIELLKNRKEPTQLLFEEWEFYTLLTGLGTVFGVLGGILLTDLTDYVALLVYNVCAFLINNIVYVILLRKQIDGLNRS